MASTTIERKDIEEVVGIALNATDLSTRTARERPIDLIAAVGAASARLYYGSQSVPIAGAAFRPEGTDADRIASDLAPMLWHLRAGGQEQTVDRVAAMFAAWLRHKPEFARLNGSARLPDAARQDMSDRLPTSARLDVSDRLPTSARADVCDLVPRFSAQVVHEWLSGRCRRCRGAGVLELHQTAGRIAPTTHARGVRYVVCDYCQGTRNALPNHQQRMRCLGVDRATYDAGRWYQRFRRGRVWLEKISRRLRRPLQIESGRYRIAPQ